MKNGKKLHWAILTTGWGRNAHDCIEAYANGELKKSSIKLLIYEDEICGAAEIASKKGIVTKRIERKNSASKELYQELILETLKSHQIDYVFLMNYKYIIRKRFLNFFPNRIINIHPSLFPSFLNTKTAIQDALAYGVKVTGITTHIIDHKVDEGEILCQHPIRIHENDTFETVYPRFAAEGQKVIQDTIELIEKRADV